MTTTEVREKPILFNSEMVRAILDGRKTVTRRPVKPQPLTLRGGGIQFPWATFFANGTVHTWDRDGVGGENWNANEHPSENKYAESLKRTPYEGACPFGQVGDLLWVRETFLEQECVCQASPAALRSGCRFCSGRGLDVIYKTDHPNLVGFKPNIHMPRWAARIFLEVTDVRVERLRDISEADAMADGGWTYATCPFHKAPVKSFEQLWDAIYGKEFPWASNPWVWRVEFRRLP